MKLHKQHLKRLKNTLSQAVETGMRKPEQKAKLSYTASLTNWDL